MERKIEEVREVHGRVRSSKDQERRDSTFVLGNSFSERDKTQKL